jgi:hypothetical protein
LRLDGAALSEQCVRVAQHTVLVATLRMCRGFVLRSGTRAADAFFACAR